MRYRYDIHKGMTKIKTKVFYTMATFGLLLGGGGLSLALLGTASAVTPQVIYDALPSVSPQTSYPSQPFQAQQTFEFGDSVHFGGTARVLNTVTVTMVTWAKYSDYQNDSRYSANNQSWVHPITLTVYSNHLGSNGVPDTVLAQKTQSITIPWRPESDPTCLDTGYGVGFAWRDASGTCRNGLAFNASFDMSSPNVTLPNDAILSVAYNTGTWGYNPIGVTGPYDSLNVAVPPSQPVAVGSDSNTNAVFWNTATCSYYADGGAAGCNIFRQDTNWAPYGTVAFQVTATPALPISKDQCKNDGWKTYGSTFKNQGDCVSFVATGGRNLPSGQ